MTGDLDGSWTTKRSGHDYLHESHIRWRVEPVGPDKPKLRFVRKKDGALREIVGHLRFFGGPIFLEARYDEEQQSTQKVALLEWESFTGTKSMELVLMRTPEDPRLYRSTAFYVLPPHMQEEPTQAPTISEEQPSPARRVEP